MRAQASLFDSGARTLSYVLGSAVIALAAAAFFAAKSPTDIAHWMGDVLSWLFVGLLGALVLTAVFSWVRMLHLPPGPETQLWRETGIQAANGVATLALTFTLLGISLGIATLAGQELTPETVQPVIRKMTANFSLAFMTTVVGLPLSAALRALIIVAGAYRLAGSASSPSEDN